MAVSKSQFGFSKNGFQERILDASGYQRVEAKRFSRRVDTSGGALLLKYQSPFCHVVYAT